MNTPEEWRPVVGFECVYEVSNLGKVRRSGRAARTGNGHGGGAVIGRVLKQHRTSNGYVVVQLWRDGKHYGKLMHVMVANSFIGPAQPGQEVNHMDGVKNNNRPENLEYVTRSENNRHAYKMGLRRPVSGPNRKRQHRTSVQCLCGCGRTLISPDPKGRHRSYLVGHGARKATQCAS